MGTYLYIYAYIYRDEYGEKNWQKPLHCTALDSIGAAVICAVAAAVTVTTVTTVTCHSLVTVLALVNAHAKLMLYAHAHAHARVNAIRRVSASAYCMKWRVLYKKEHKYHGSRLTCTTAIS